MATVWLLITASTAAEATAGEAGGRPAAVRSALNRIFADDHVVETAIDVKRRAMTMSPVERYEFLSEWVLPRTSRPWFRLSIDFTEANQEPSVIASSSIDQRYVVGTNLVSPATVLVDTAEQLNVLPELRQRIKDCPAEEMLQQRCRLAMLVLVDLASGNFESAEQNLITLDDWTHNSDRIEASHPEILAIVEGLKHEQTRMICQESAAQLYEVFSRRHPQSEHNVWQHLIVSLGAISQPESRDNLNVQAGRQPLTNWVAVSHATAQSRGSGHPTGKWMGYGGAARNLTSHNSDYLYYRIPLEGNFSVECDVTGFDWRHSQLSVAGTWAAPTWQLDRYESGQARTRRPETMIEPALSAVGHWNRYRSVVRDGNVTSYFNGREIHKQPLPPEYEPWIAVRSPWYADGAIRNLRIAGRPEVQHRIQLAGLDSWTEYFADRMGLQWRQISNQESSQIVGDRVAHLQESGLESLLQYSRPMLEDGRIEYDFFYNDDDSENASAVYPALNRLAFVLTDEGVRTHRITNGAYDRSNVADPLNSHFEPEYQRGPDQMPLKQNNWNHLELNLTGSTVQLMLNQQLVYECNLDPAGQRTFGLFHYADRTEARIRNAMWTGDWPKTLPDEDAQQLAEPQPAYPELTLKQTLHHDFVQNGMPDELFSFSDVAKGAASIQKTANGLLMKCSGSQNYSHCYLSGKFRIEGDFDITAAFDSLSTEADQEGSSGITLRLVFAEDSMRECAIYRGLIRKVNAADRQEMHFHQHYAPDGNVRHVWDGMASEESPAGRMRFIRQGTTLYSLLAEGDSNYFRLISTQPVSDVAINNDFLRLTAQTIGKSTASVVWKNITVRADRLDVTYSGQSKAQLATLQRQAEQLPSRFVRDFSRQPPVPGDFFVWPRNSRWDSRDKGHRILSAGTDDWNTAGVNVRRTVTGNFDIRARFDIRDLPTPMPGQQSVIYLSADTQESAIVRTNLVFSKNEKGITKALAEKRITKADGSMDYQLLGSMELDSATGLRLTRRDGILTLIASADDSSDDHVIGATDVPDVPIDPSQIRFIVHTGGAGLESDVLLKSIEIRADGID